MEVRSIVAILATCIDNQAALLYYPAALDIVDRHEIIGLINAAPYLMCIFSCW